MERFSQRATRTYEMPLLSTSEEDRTKLLLDYARCYERRGTPDTWGSTPTDIQASLADQSRLIHAFARRFTVPNYLKDIDPSISDYMESTFLDRFVSRCVANDENYRRALSPVPFGEVDDNILYEQRVVEERAAAGQASPAELIALQAIHGIGAIELASLTHPYGANIEYMKDMRQAVETSIKLFGGEVFEEPEEVYSISDVINGMPAELIDPTEYMPLSRAEKIQRREEFDGVAGILMTRKRTLGQLADGTTIRQRTSFILTKESGLLTDDVLEQFASTANCDHWGREAVRSVYGLDEMLKALLDTDNFSQVLPVSTTIYSFNKERVDQINAVIEQTSANHNGPLNGHVVHDKLRHLAAAQLRSVGESGMVRQAAPKYVEVNNMAFFGDFNDTNSLPIRLPSEDK